MPHLPIDAVIPDLKHHLKTTDQVVLEAPPGAGKTTGVPLALLDAYWLGERKILMLEPRRLAARAAAERMASVLGEKVGGTVGYRVRLDTCVSKETRIEVVTEGILTRMLQSDPSLDEIGLVIFDEFHERSLDADLALALVLQGRALFREDDPLKLLVMSATLDGEALSLLLDNAPVVRSEGRAFPVAVRYGAVAEGSRLDENGVARTVIEALHDETGSVLVFLPGQREIQRTQTALQPMLDAAPALANVMLVPLYGDLNLAQQRAAIEPAPIDKRKVVLATAIAETSLTIEGVRVVVDAGLSRESVFDPTTGMSRLITRRLSRASSVQRAGRAGRMEPGVCYRLWSETQQAQLAPYTAPEMSQADLSGLVLQLAQWGVNDPAELSWLDLPPTAPYQQAQDLLVELGAIERTPQGIVLTEHGERMASLPTHPRLAHMLVVGSNQGVGRLACDVAALLSERDPMGRDKIDLLDRVAWLRGELRLGKHTEGVRQRIRQQSKQFMRLSGLTKTPSEKALTEAETQRWLGLLIASAYPDRVACRRSAGRESTSGEYRLSNGRAARLPEGCQTQAEWLAIAQAGGRSGHHTDQIYLAAELDPAMFDDQLAALVQQTDVVSWDKNSDRLTAERQCKIGKLVLSRTPLSQIDESLCVEAVLNVVRRRGLTVLPWSDSIRGWQARVQFLHHEFAAKEDNPWPDLSDQALLENLEDWLAPYVGQIRHQSHFANLDLKNILQALLSWPLPQQLDALAPERFQVPSGSRIRIDYDQSPPVLAVRMQEMFGCKDTPAIANGCALKLHLLSPAMRPLQVTQDLVGFWSNSYPEVQKEMKGRYPKHRWPDDPANEQPSQRSIKPKR